MTGCLRFALVVVLAVAVSCASSAAHSPAPAQPGGTSEPNPDGAADPDSAAADTRRADIEQALERLRTRTANDSFVIIELSRSGGFVQFGSGPSLVIDVPLGALNAEQAARARGAFARLGVATPNPYTTSDGLSGETYNYDFGPNAARAAEVALELLDTIYQPGADAHIVIEEN